MLALGGLSLLYLLTFFNRFVGLRSGNGEFFTGLAFLHGQLPYRDYFTATPCLNTFKSALLLHMFGPFLIVSRLAGVLERVSIGLLLYRWLRLMFPAGASFLAALATLVVSAGDRSDPIASYNHDAILWAMLSGFAAACALRAGGLKGPGRLAGWAAASGCGGGALPAYQADRRAGSGASGAVSCAFALAASRSGPSSGIVGGRVSCRITGSPCRIRGMADPAAADGHIL